MGLSRLDNFLKSVKGAIIYVDPNSLDSTDSIENQGNSLSRPFKTVQRALIEAARFSYQRGLENDRFNKTTILLYPGDHIIDNRPGWIPLSASSYRLRNGLTSNDYSAWDLTTNFDLSTTNNALYKLNSIHGGVIVPRGCSIIGMDLRKTKLRPTYVPNPENDDIERTALLRITGASFFSGFTILDADPNGFCYKDYTDNRSVPNFSHHKLTVFEYADGVNAVDIDDAFQTYSTTRTDSDMYYEKVGLAYGSASGREIQPDYPSSGIDIQSLVDEYRIVGSRGAEVGISSIRAGDGLTSDTTISVVLSADLPGLAVDTPIQIQGVQGSGYDGQYVVTEVLSANEIKYKVQNPPVNPAPSATGSTLNISVDTVTSASPYIFNCSLRSVYGMCGLHADGSKAEGFKSMVLAQFTGIGLQKDQKAFVKYDSVVGEYRDSTTLSNLSSDTRSVFKPTYENYHIKASNDAFLQLVSIFAIGYANHFVAESGGDHSITNSNSNFGAKSLVSKGFREDAFIRDDLGFITHIISPQENDISEGTVEFVSIDVAKTIQGQNDFKLGRLYLYNQNDLDLPPNNVLDGYRIGAKPNDNLFVEIIQSGIATEYSAKIAMPETQGTIEPTAYEKSFDVGVVGSSNNINSNVITFNEVHTFISGESIRIISDNGDLPSGIKNNTVYYAITNSIDPTLSLNQIKVSQTQNDAIRNNALTINSKGGRLKVVSRVSDKNSGDIGHPIQYDSSYNQWYICVENSSQIISQIVSLGTGTLGDATSRTYIKRRSDTRNLNDTVYRVRYVIPQDSPIAARPPLNGFILQESNSTTGADAGEIAKYYSLTSSSLSNSVQLKNFKFISNATWDGSSATITSELPHGLSVGSVIEVLSIVSSNNTTGKNNFGFNGKFVITSIPTSTSFTYSLPNNPGVFTNNTSIRDLDLPRFRRKNLKNIYQIYQSQEIQEYIPNRQDGIYYLTLINFSNSPVADPFTEEKFSQPIRNLYPQANRDNPISDPPAAKSFALSSPVGEVVVNEPESSITKETVEKIVEDFQVGFGITSIISNADGTQHTLYTNLDHGFSGITSVSITFPGFNYLPGTYYAANLVGAAGSSTGDYATARIVVNASGNISDLKIMNPGSAYGIGNTLSVVPVAGVGTTAGHIPAVVEVTNVSQNIGDTFDIIGVAGTDSRYNTSYRIVGINSVRQIQVASAATISNSSTTEKSLPGATAIPTGKVLQVNNFQYDSVVGLATIGFTDPHGFRINSKVKVSGSNTSFFNEDVIVTRINNSNEVVVNYGPNGSGVSTDGTYYVFKPYLTSNGGILDRDNENSGVRLIYQYGGVTTTLGNIIERDTPETNPFVINNADVLGFKIGDYILINNEIFRIKDSVTENSVFAFRSLLGTRRQRHETGSVIRKIRIIPVETRRNSIIRASGHTFEYIGFGPGNYSTALPERQDRQLSIQEELLSQATKMSGGAIVYTAMNSNGDFYNGNVRTNSLTGREEIFDTPVLTYTGEDLLSGNNAGVNVVNSDDITITRSLRVEGGPDGNIITEFNGPVIFNNKITSNSPEGIETHYLNLQGQEKIARQYTIGISTPVSAGNPGDLVFQSTPNSGEPVGWIYTTDNTWNEFGPIKNVSNQYTGNFIGSFSGDGSELQNVSDIWQPDAAGIHTTRSVGINTNNSKSEYALYVNGSSEFQGTLKVFEIIETATISSEILGLVNPVNIDLGDNNVYYFSEPAVANWTLNFRGSSGQDLNDFLNIGDSMTVAVMTTQGATPYYTSSITIDGNPITPKYYGGFTNLFGNANSIDVYTFVLLKTGDAQFVVLVSQSQYA